MNRRFWVKKRHFLGMGISAKMAARSGFKLSPHFALK